MAVDHFSKFQAYGKTTVLNTNPTILMGYDSEDRATLLITNFKKMKRKLLESTLHNKKVWIARGKENIF